MKKNHIFILGMHRSGTSFISRSLNLCGLDLGPESDFFDTEWQPKFGNPKGHWENFKVIKLNDEILKINGGSWHRLPKSLKKTPPKFKTKILNILKPFYERNSLSYGFKDPRFCLTFEKWKKHLQSYAVVGIFRDPLKVAESLKKRDGFTYEESLNLWRKYNEELLSILKKHNGFLLNFDWPEKKLIGQTKLVAKKIGLVDVEISNWYSGSYKISDKSFKSDYSLPNDIKKIYENLKILSEKNKLRKYAPPKLTKSQQEPIISDLIKSSNNIYFETLRHIHKNQELQKQKQKDILKHSPLVTLLSLYYQRKDLQKKFPEVTGGDLLGLANWAKNISLEDVRGEIVTKENLLKHSKWYSKFVTENQNRKAKAEQEISLIKNKQNLLETENTNYKKSVDSLQQENTNYKKSVDSLQQENTNYKKSVDSLQQENTNYKKSVDSLQQENSEFREKTMTLEIKKTNIAKELDQYKKNEQSLANTLSETKKELDDIKYSKSFRAVRSVTSQIEKIKKKKRVIRDVGATISASKKTIETEGVGAFVNHAKQRIKRRQFLLHSSMYDVTPFDLTSKKEISQVTITEIPHQKQKFDKTFNVSVVIPTNADEKSLQFLINTINSQKGFENIQIVLVNSGKNILSSLETLSNVKCVNIKSEDFNHGTTRYLGFTESTGDFIIYLTDDAIPSSDHLFYDMCNVFTQDEKIAVVTARQIPRSDSDLMSIFTLNEYYAHLNLSEDRIISTSNFEKLDSIEKRRTSQIDDVCSCYKREILSNYQFREISTGEDLDVGIRLVKDGYKIAQLFSTGVIHSHNRPASYYLKRGFVETRTFSSFFDQPVYDFKKHGIQTVDDVFNHALSLYNSLNHTIDLLKQNKTTDIEEAFKIISNDLPHFYSKNSVPKTKDPSLDPIFDKFTNENGTAIKDNFLLLDYLHSLNAFKNFLKKTYPNLCGNEKEFFNTLHKKFGLIVGDRLGSFVLLSENQNSKDEKLEQLENYLESGF